MSMTHAWLPGLLQKHHQPLVEEAAVAREQLPDQLAAGQVLSASRENGTDALGAFLQRLDALGRARVDAQDVVAERRRGETRQRLDNPIEFEGLQCAYVHSGLEQMGRGR